MLRAAPHLGTWSGVALLALGFALLVLAWGRVASFTSVGLQLPWLVSAGFSGLGLVVCGVTVIAVATRAEADAVRRAQLEELRQTLAALREELERQ